MKRTLVVLIVGLALGCVERGEKRNACWNELRSQWYGGLTMTCCQDVMYQGGLNGWQPAGPATCVEPTIVKPDVGCQGE